MMWTFANGAVPVSLTRNDGGVEVDVRVQCLLASHNFGQPIEDRHPVGQLASLEK